MYTFIRSLKTPSQWATGNWAPQQWAIESRNWNPWNDSFIMELQTLRYSYALKAKSLDPSFMVRYWQTAPESERAIAEAEFQWYRDETIRLLIIEWCYIWDTYLGDELTRLDSFKFDHEAIEHDPSEGLIDEIRPIMGTLEYNLPPILPIVKVLYETELARLGEFASFESVHPIPNTIEVRNTSEYREQAAWQQHELDESWRELSKELSIVAKEKNSLSGMSAKNRFLLINENIPLPRIETYPAWSQLCALYSGQWDPEHLISFIPPHLPVTKEHRSGAALQTDDSHADHSLPARSAGHERTPGGAIRHGIVMQRTALIHHGIEVVHGAVIRDSSGPAHRLPIAPNLRWDLNKAKAHWYRVSGYYLRSFICDPYRNDRFRLTATWMSDGAPDWGWRWLAKYYNIHFRFDDSPRGARTIIEWSQSFMEAAHEYHLMSQHELSLMRFRMANLDALSNQQPRQIMKSSPVRGGATYDFSGL